MADAQQWCDENLGYLKVIGRLTMTVPGKRDEDGNIVPDWENRVDLDEGRWNWDHNSTTLTFNTLKSSL